MRCKILSRIVVIFLFTTIFLYSISFGATVFFEDDYYSEELAFSNEDSKNFYASLRIEYNKKGTVYNALQPYLDDDNYNYYCLEDIPIFIMLETNLSTNISTYYAFMTPKNPCPYYMDLYSVDTTYIRPYVCSYPFTALVITFSDKSFSFTNVQYKSYNVVTNNIGSGYFTRVMTESSSYYDKIVFCNTDLVDNNGSRLFYGTLFRYKVWNKPFIGVLKTKMENGFSADDNIEVVINDFPNLEGDANTINTMYFSITNTITGEEIYSTTLGRDSGFYSYVEGAEDMPFYRIPVRDFYENFVIGNEYSFKISYDFEGKTETDEQVLIYGYNYSQDEESGETGNSTIDNTTVIGGMTNSIIESNDKLSNTIIDSNNRLQNSIDEQTNTIKENTETNKNIFERIGEILSYINPLSDNFFGKKLVELIVEALKSLFVPDEEFTKSFLNDFDVFLTEHFGLLYQPFDMVIDLLNKFLEIDLEEPSINVPDIKEPFTGEILLAAFEFKFNSILETEVFNYIHEIYLLAIDAMLVFIIIKQIGRIEREVFGK